ncbi:hypothetical protein ANN_01253 [Periplaneta americana]|uniref:Uncharacterized protein n=1 Tax=Periplaneta americana TaxID=6978 RepID=A0ABQ8TT26_PERAM|nr:hypothetical protein ANN_01253 [Periplaneta americana]
MAGLCEGGNEPLRWAGFPEIKASKDNIKMDLRELILGLLPFPTLSSHLQGDQVAQDPFQRPFQGVEAPLKCYYGMNPGRDIAEGWEPRNGCGEDAPCRFLRYHMMKDGWNGEKLSPTPRLESGFSALHDDALSTKPHQIPIPMPDRIPSV